MQGALILTSDSSIQQLIDILVDKYDFPPEMAPYVERVWNGITAGMSEGIREDLHDFFYKMADQVLALMKAGKTSIPGDVVEKLSTHEDFPDILFKWTDTFNPDSPRFRLEAWNRGLINLDDKDMIAAIIKSIMS